MSHKGSWDRSDPRKVQESEYWKPENVERRKRLVEEQRKLTPAQFEAIKKKVKQIHSK